MLNIHCRSTLGLAFVCSLPTIVLVDASAIVHFTVAAALAVPTITSIAVVVVLVSLVGLWLSSRESWSDTMSWSFAYRLATLGVILCWDVLDTWLLVWSPIEVIVCNNGHGWMVVNLVKPLYSAYGPYLRVL